jgi:hypothetical protein
MKYQVTGDTTGLCVAVTQTLDRNGNRRMTAKHKRDSATTYKCSMQTGDPLEVLSVWMTKFTGCVKPVPGFTADFAVVARGGDHQGYYFIIVPTNYN